MRGARGQTLLLFVLCLLLLVLMVVMTLSIGTKVKQKSELQTAADAAAYSNATATARTFNTVSLLNRAAISQWVAMAGIQSLTTWGSLAGSYMGELGHMAYTFQVPVPGKYCAMQDGMSPGSPGYDAACSAGWGSCGSGCPADCTGRTSDTRAAAYEFWHARYSLYNGPGAGGDAVNQYCIGDGQTCSVPRYRKSPGFGQLDREVAKQEQAVMRSIHNLNRLEQNVWGELEDRLRDQDLTDRALRASQGLPARGGTPPGFRVLSGANQPGLKQVKKRVVEDEAPAHDRATYEAALGSIGRKFPTWMERPPPQVDRFIREIQSNLDATHPGRFRFGRVNGQFRGCAFFSEPGADDARCPDSLWGWDAATSSARDLVFMRYNDACTRRWREHPSPPGRFWPVTVNLRSAMGDPSSANPSTHGGTADYMDGAEFIGGCHGTHGYWGTIGNHDHALGRPMGNGRDDLLSGSLAYVFPAFGPTGAEGQPKIPVLLSRRQDVPGQLHDPWDLTVRFRLSGGPGGELDLKEARVHGAPAVQGALANGIAYYHRRGYWQEPGNLLNPFWHATLVPANIDRPDRSGGRSLDRTEDSLRGAGYDDSADIYRRFMRLAPPYQGVQ